MDLTTTGEANCEIWADSFENTCDTVIGLPTPIYDQENCADPSK